jgi:hypothetical protein
MIARYFRWSEHFILWELPVARGNAYCHSLMRMHNMATKPAHTDDRFFPPEFHNL